MANDIPYPFVAGFRHGFASVAAEFKLRGGKTVTFRGFKGINYTRTRDRGIIYGNHPDPLGKTRGQNSYSADCEVYLAEFAKLVEELGAGYGDIPFTVLVHFVEGGFAGLQDEIQGCTFDSTDASNAQGTDGLSRKFNLNPLKILFDGLDDVETPLAPQQAP